jgi:hypothetical protein
VQGCLHCCPVICLNAAVAAAAAAADAAQQVVMYDCFRPGDVVRAQVLSLGDARSYYLTTADNSLGVVHAKSLSGVPQAGPRKQLKQACRTCSRVLIIGQQPPIQCALHIAEMWHPREFCTQIAGKLLNAIIGAFLLLSPAPSFSNFCYMVTIRDAWIIVHHQLHT